MRLSIILSIGLISTLMAESSTNAINAEVITKESPITLDEPIRTDDPEVAVSAVLIEDVMTPRVTEHKEIISAVTVSETETDIIETEKDSSTVTIPTKSSGIEDNAVSSSDNTPDGAVITKSAATVVDTYIVAISNSNVNETTDVIEDENDVELTAAIANCDTEKDVAVADYVTTEPTVAVVDSDTVGDPISIEEYPISEDTMSMDYYTSESESIIENSSTDVSTSVADFITIEAATVDDNAPAEADAVIAEAAGTTAAVIVGDSDSVNTLTDANGAEDAAVAEEAVSNETATEVIITEDNADPIPMFDTTAVRILNLVVNGEEIDDPSLAIQAMECFDNVCTYSDGIEHVEYSLVIKNLQIEENNTLSVTVCINNPSNTATFSIGTICHLIETNSDGIEAIVGETVCTAESGNTVTFSNIPLTTRKTRLFYVDVEPPNTLIDVAAEQVLAEDNAAIIIEPDTSDHNAAIEEIKDVCDAGDYVIGGGSDESIVVVQEDPDT
ncbi:MAG: hypothetical protein IJV69_01525, partial [Kiritimatiellae bacterium]|nr:hypothetical protein [Kiritimatiellia bacterium]